MALKKDEIYTTSNRGQAKLQFRKGYQLDHYRLFAFLVSTKRDRLRKRIRDKNKRRKKNEKIDLSAWRNQFADGESYR